MGCQSYTVSVSFQLFTQCDEWLYITARTDDLNDDIHNQWEVFSISSGTAAGASRVFRLITFCWRRGGLQPIEQSGDAWPVLFDTDVEPAISCSTIARLVSAEARSIIFWIANLAPGLLCSVHHR
jgi:hypothetical protein